MLNIEARFFQKYREKVFSQLYYIFCFIYIIVSWASFAFRPVFWKIYSEIKWIFGINTVLFGLQQAGYALSFSFDFLKNKSKFFFNFLKQKKEEFRKKWIKKKKEYQIKKNKKGYLKLLVFLYTII